MLMVIPYEQNWRMKPSEGKGSASPGAAEFKMEREKINE